jgi:hypothetical protein
MATLSREIAIYIDGSRSGGLDAVLDGKLSTARSYPHALMAGDKCPLKVFFRARDPQNGASTAVELAAGSTMVVAGRTTAGVILFASSSFTAAGTGDDAYMGGTIDLATVEIETALTATKYGSSIDIYIDIEVRDAGNTERLTFRAAAKLYKQVYDGSSIATSIAFGTLTAPDLSQWQLTIGNDGQLSATRIL